MVKTIIAANPIEKREVPKDKVFLNIAECFSQTIQGEGVTIGRPSTFLRLQHCTLNCVWCDSKEVWRQGNPYTIDEVLDLFEANGVVDDLKNGHHLVLTGGSPLLQQDKLIVLLTEFRLRFGFKPFLEIENECTLMPKDYMLKNIDMWNCSPKLENSQMKEVMRIKPEVLKTLNTKTNNVIFKFVISNKSDWDEIKRDFIDTGYISRDKIILMPEGMTREELHVNYQKVLAICIKEGLPFTDRLHITIWNKKVGV